jgi:hypothetical protein
MSAAGPSTMVGARQRPRVALVLLLLVALVASVIGCSKDESPQVGVNGTLAPKTTGGGCTDPRGDISGDPDLAGSRSEPAGIDLLKVEAKVTESSLKVTYEMAGPIAGTPKPTFILSQGPSAQTVSFEIRATPGPDPAQPWSLELVTWKVTTSGNGEVRQAMADVARVNGSTLTYDIPLKNLPPIATLIWIFGAQSGEQGGVLDDCSSYEAPSGTLPPETAPGSTAPPATAADVKLGEAQEHKGGELITVYEVQDPPAKPKKLDVQPDAGRRLVLVNVQFCASADRPGIAKARQFGITLVTNEIIPIWDQKQTTVDLNYPDFPESEPLEPGKCRRGWISFSLALEAKIAEVFYSTTPFGDDVVLWKLAPTLTPSGPPPSTSPTTAGPSPSPSTSAPTAASSTTTTP